MPKKLLNEEVSEKIDKLATACNVKSANTILELMIQIYGDCLIERLNPQYKVISPVEPIDCTIPRSNLPEVTPLLVSPVTVPTIAAKPEVESNPTRPGVELSPLEKLSSFKF